MAMLMGMPMAAPMSMSMPTAPVAPSLVLPAGSDPLAALSDALAHARAQQQQQQQQQQIQLLQMQVQMLQQQQQQPPRLHAHNAPCIQPHAHFHP